jgi:regulator of sirC expression with transglutaminase-like and TPR domain
MSEHFNYEVDVEFQKLLARRSDVNLTVAALEIARDAQPDLDFAPTLEWIAGCSHDLAAAVARARTDRLMLKELGRCIAGMHGLHGAPEAFGMAEGSYLHRVVATGIGIPISLSLVYMAVADQVGIDLAGVAAPKHFLCRFDSANGPLFIDAFGGGRVMSRSQCLKWLGELTQLTVDELVPSLAPASPRVIILRMLNNLKALHVQQDQWLAAYRVQSRLLSLQPTDFDQMRDLGLIAVKANRPGVALKQLERCLQLAPAQQRAMISRHMAEAKRLVAAWN